MAVTINASTSAGLVNTADTSGVLQLQTAGTTALTVDASQNVTLANATTIQGLTVGRGAGAVSTNTAVGASALAANTTGLQNTAVGQLALRDTTTGQENTVVGRAALYQNTTGSSNTAIGVFALSSNTTASNNTAVGYRAAYSITTGFNNTIVGKDAGYSLTTGTFNTFIGSTNSLGNGSGELVTTGTKNTILGGYNGNQDSLDIRTASNYAVISDGDGNRQITMKEGQTLALDSAVPNAGTGITFPATQSASTDVNTLDDYEEGTWTPVLVPTSGSITTQTNSGAYTKIGGQVTVNFLCIINNVGTATALSSMSGLPFASSSAAGVGAGRESSSTGLMWQWLAGSGLTALSGWTYANNSAIATGYSLRGTLTYFV